MWAKQGFDVDRVKTHGKPFDDPTMGLVYQVKTWWSGDKKWEDMIHEHLMKLLKKPDTASCSNDPAGPSAAVEPAAAVPNTVPSSDSSSSSSSSSSEKKKKSKNKGAKKSKKEKRKDKKAAKKEKEKQLREEEKKRAKEESEAKRAADKAEQARVRKIHNDVSKALAKVTPIVVSLSEQLKDKFVSHLPSFAQLKADAAMKMLSSIEKESKQSLAASNPEAPSFTTQAVTEACQDGTSATTLLKQLLEAAKKHA